MPFTDRSDLFASLHEEGINNVVRQIMRQRPSLFNYATKAFHDKRLMAQLCAPIKAAREVERAGDPLFTEMDLLPLIGSAFPLGLDWCFQLSELQVDFHPGNVIALPAELGVLPEQQFALVAKACFGLNCPPGKGLEQYLSAAEAATETLVHSPKDKNDKRDDKKPAPKLPSEPVPLPTGNIQCFCMALYITGHFEWGTMGSDPGQWLKTRVDGIEIVDIGPDKLESMIECYLRNVLRFGILPRLSIPLEAMVLDVTSVMREAGLRIGEHVELRPALGPGIANNPSIEKDELRMFLELSITP